MELLERVLLVELFSPRLILLFLLELQPLELAKLLLDLVQKLGLVGKLTWIIPGGSPIKSFAGTILIQKDGYILIYLISLK